MYLASIVNVVTNFCFLLAQLIGPPLSMNTLPRIDSLSLRSEAKSELEYLIRPLGLFLPKVIP
jgi:hypothetical protein